MFITLTVKKVEEQWLSLNMVTISLKELNKMYNTHRFHI